MPEAFQFGIVCPLTAKSIANIFSPALFFSDVDSNPTNYPTKHEHRYP